LRARSVIGEEESMLDSMIHMYLAAAEWLHGRLEEAERAFASILAEWRAAGEGFVAARVCHHLGQVQRARGRLDAALGSYRQALAAAGDENAAVDALAQALMLGCPQGYVRVFADEGAPMAALLARLVAAQKADQAAARGVPLGCMARLLRAFSGQDAASAAGRDAAAAVPGLVEQLTARELDILRLLAAGAPNPRIAAELVVRLDTVKKHVSHLLGKLGAANRTEAVTRARELGLIP
jgi:DNA-binding NarL/FixJ family response regulator